MDFKSDNKPSSVGSDEPNKFSATTSSVRRERLPTSGQYSLIVQAVDSGLPPKEAQVNVQIQVKNSTYALGIQKAHFSA